MKMNSTVRCCGIKESDVEIEGKKFSSTKFHLIVDIADNNAGQSCGFETRPFTFGDSSEFKKWAHLKAGWPDMGVMVDAVFDVVAAAEGKTKLTLLDIRPAKLATPVSRPA
jgi:hypothetical protein